MTDKNQKVLDRTRKVTDRANKTLKKQAEKYHDELKKAYSVGLFI